MDRSFYFTDRGNAANEDFAYATRDYGVLLDGATCLAGAPLFPSRFSTNAQWLSHTVGASICRLLDAGLCARDAVGRAVDEARDEFERAVGSPVSQVPPQLLPSATLSVAVVGDGRVELLGLGDSPGFVELASGEVLVFTDERLEALDAAAVAAMGERAGSRDLTGRERRALVDDVVRENRAKLNVDGGYWCLDPTGAALDHMRRRTFDACDVVAVGGMSDGMYHAFSTFGLASLGAGASWLDHHSVQALVDRMRTVEASDPGLTRFPRLKLGDDASVYVLRPAGRAGR